jgi:flagellar biosynthetic protein FlhB
MSDQDKSQKTEEPTSKRLSEAHSKGQVAKSAEISTWIMLASSTLVLALFVDRIAIGVANEVYRFLESPHLIAVDTEGAMDLIRLVFYRVGALLFMPLLLLVIAAIVGNVVQHRLVFTFEKMKPKLDKLSPLKGAKRMLGPQSAVNLAKSLLKFVVLGGVALIVILPEFDDLPTFMQLGFVDLLQLIKRLALMLAISVVSVFTALAALDMLYQKWDFHQNQKMSRQDVKDENKQMEGDPQVKARIRQLRMERTRQRMMTAVPTADVVITNPTHFAVALAYKHEEMAVPQLVAKGQDLVALRIRKLAEEHDVPIVENPPLARALCATVELGEEIPPQLYQAVAEIIGYVMGLRPDSGRSRRLH